VESVLTRGDIGW